MPKYQRDRAKIMEALNHLRRLRNRVFHHEPICSVTQPDVQQRHQALHQVIGWISPSVNAFLAPTDLFDDVYQHGEARLRQQIADALAVTETPV